MKKVLILTVLFFLAISCKKEPKNFVTLNGTVENIEGPIDSVVVFKPDLYKKNIFIKPDGSFSDTLKVSEGSYLMKIGDEYLKIYLKNGETISLSTDYPNFDETLNFKGDGMGAKASNLFVDIMMAQEKYFDREIESLQQLDITSDSVQQAFNQLKEKYKDVSPVVWKEVENDFNENVKGTEDFIKNRLQVRQDTDGKPAPPFSYEDINGERVSLDDFKGKYVYIDVWATWCGPCKKEIPYLQKIEEEYKDKNIAFISISVDKGEDKEKWEKFVKDKNLGGVQLFSDNDWNSDFIKAYKVQGIPRFILINPEGLTIDADAPTPSNPKLKEILNKLLMS